MKFQRIVSECVSIRLFAALHSFVAIECYSGHCVPFAIVCDVGQSADDKSLHMILIAQWFQTSISNSIKSNNCKCVRCCCSKQLYVCVWCVLLGSVVSTSSHPSFGRLRRTHTTHINYFMLVAHERKVYKRPNCVSIEAYVVGTGCESVSFGHKWQSRWWRQHLPFRKMVALCLSLVHYLSPFSFILSPC